MGANEPAPSADAGSLLKAACKIIEREYASPLTPQRLARRLRLPRLAFQRAFHDAVGATPQVYLRSCRMRAAAQLLEAGRRAHDVAILVGYSRYALFIADYRREYRADLMRMRALERMS